MIEKKIDLGTSTRVIEEFQTTLHRSSGDLQGVWARIEYEEYEPCEPTVTLFHPELSKTFDIRGIVGSDNECRLTCSSPFEFPIRFWGIVGSKFSGEKLELRVTGYDIGCSDNAVPVGEEVTVFAYLTKGQVVQGLQIPTYSFDGTITHTHKEKDIEWEDDRRQTILRMQHEYENAVLGTNKALLQVARPAFIQTFLADGRQTLRSIIERTEEDLRDTLVLLSFCSRERVQWFEISVETYKSKERPRLYPRAKRRGWVPAPRHREREDPLIAHRDLTDGGFKRLLDLFRQSQHKEMLRRAISYQVASRQVSGGIETHYILCHAGLEAVANELSAQDPTIPRYKKGQWKLLRRSLEGLIDSFAQTNGLQKNLIQYTKRKLPELGRLAIADSILHYANTLGIRVDDLWPSSIGFENGLRTALHLRNSLMHRAVIIDPVSMYENLIRLQVLTERFVLKILGWPEDKVWVWSTQTLKRVNRE